MINTKVTKGLYIKTYGCQMNVYDSEMIEELLLPLGYKLVHEIQDAEIVVLNTCNIREKATEKMYSDLGRIKNAEKQKNSKIITVVAGCVAQAEGASILNRASNVDIVVGPQTLHTLPETIGKIKRKYHKDVNIDFPIINKFDALKEDQIIKTGNVSAFISVQEGCDKFCSFCCVPYTRGAEYSRNVDDVYREALRLIASGVKEIYLLGQNVSAYHGKLGNEEWSLGKLIKHIASINGIERLRYTTSHPIDMHEDLYNAHTLNTVMPFKHMPIQTGSNHVLKSMNRKHTVEEYIKIFHKFKTIRPDIELSSDFIVGFPGETEADFQKTLEIVNYIKYPIAYSFKYSPRPGTPGANRKNQVSEDIKSDRLNRLQKLLNEIRIEFNKNCEDQLLEVLFENRNKNTGQLFGKTIHMQNVYVDCKDDNLIAKKAIVKITKSNLNSLNGVLI